MNVAARRNWATMMQRHRRAIGLICVLVLVAGSRGFFAAPSSGAEACIDWGFYEPANPTNPAHQGGLRPWYAESAGRLGTWQENKPLIDSAFAAGQRPFITWEFWTGVNDGTNPYPLRDIAAGKFDGYLDSWASGVATYDPKPVYLRIFHEMNDPYSAVQGHGYPWSVAAGNPFGNAPTDLADAWRHIHARFQAAGAINAKWVFNSDNDLANNPIPAGTYPGDTFVDLTGWDAYEPSDFESDYRQMTAISGKPMAIGESGATHADYVQTMQNGINAGRWPLLSALIVFSDHEWSFELNPGVEPAYSQLVQQPRFCRTN